MVILAGLMSGMFLAALDQTIVSTAIRTIADDLNGLSLQAWATTAYLITSTIATPLYGKLSDIYGRRPFFLAAIGIFIAGSLLSGFAQSMYQLAIFRGLPGHRRRRPVLAGAGDHRRHGAAAGARQVPGLLPRGVRHVERPRPGRRRLLRRPGDDPRDHRLALGVPRQRAGGHRLAAARGPHAAPAAPPQRPPHRLPGRGRARSSAWSRCSSSPSRAASGAGRRGRSIGCYVDRRRSASSRSSPPSGPYGKEALLPLHLFRGRTFGVGSLLNFIVGMGMFGGLAALPLYMQIVKGKSPTEAGLLLIPLMIGIMSGSVVSGQFIARTGRYKIFPIIGHDAARHRYGSHEPDQRRHLDRRRRLVRADLRPRARLQHADPRPGDPERRPAAGHGRGDVVRDVLPPDGRHARHGGLPVGALQLGARQDHRRRSSGSPRRRTSRRRSRTRRCSRTPRTRSSSTC